MTLSEFLKKTIVKRIICIFFISALALFNIVMLINVAVCLQGGAEIVYDGESYGEYDCILVLGAGLRSDGTPSDMLRDRLRGAIELYDMGVSDTVILSGDRSGEDYDEVSAMRKYCISEGVPEEAIVCDYEGYSTYESMKNVLSDGKYQRVIVVTQKYHLYRALYIAEDMGVEASGFCADYNTYRGQIFREIRELAARVKDFFIVSVFS